MHHFFPNIGNPESEHRTLSLALENVPAPESAGQAENREWKKAPGAEHLLNHFASYGTVTIKDLREYQSKYLASVGGVIQNEIDTELTAFDKASKFEDRAAAEQRLNRLCKFLGARNSVVKGVQKNLKDITLAPKEVPWSIEYVKDKASDTIGACVDGFQNATGQEKAVMLAGAVAAFLMLRNLLKSSDGAAPNASKLGKNLLKFGGGGLLVYMGLQAANKTVEKTRGRPLVDHKFLGGKGAWNQLPSFPALNPPGFGWAIGSEQKEWNEEVFAQTVDRARNELQSGPRGVLDKIFVEHKIDGDILNIKEDLPFTKEHEELMRKRRGNVAGMMNLATMDVPAFQELYETSRANNGNTDEHAAGYPHRPFKKDGLMAAERFELIKQVALAIRMIDTAGKIQPINEKRKDKSILYLMLDI